MLRNKEAAISSAFQTAYNSGTGSLRFRYTNLFRWVLTGTWPVRSSLVDKKRRPCSNNGHFWHIQYRNGTSTLLNTTQNDKMAAKHNLCTLQLGITRIKEKEVVIQNVQLAWKCICLPGWFVHYIPHSFLVGLHVSPWRWHVPHCPLLEAEQTALWAEQQQQEEE